MTEVIKFTAETKQDKGKSAVKQLKREGKIPGIIYSDNNDAATMITLPFNKFYTEFQKGSFQTKLVEITLNGKVITAIAKDVQVHPVSDKPEHVDFKKIDKDTMVKVFVSIKVLNEDKSPGVKKGGIVNIVHRSIEIMAHPTKIPHHIEIDVTGMEIGENRHMHDLKLPEGVSPVDKNNFTLISIVGRTEEKEEAATAAALPGAAAATGVPAAPGAAAAAGAPGAAAPTAGAAPAAAPAKGKK